MDPFRFRRPFSPLAGLLPPRSTMPEVDFGVGENRSAMPDVPDVDVGSAHDLLHGDFASQERSFPAGIGSQDVYGGRGFGVMGWKDHEQAKPPHWTQGYADDYYKTHGELGDLRNAPGGAGGAGMFGMPRSPQPSAGRTAPERKDIFRQYGQRQSLD